MKEIKKILSIILALILSFSAVSVGIKAHSESAYSNGDVITFGSYPQKKVDDETVKSELNKIVSKDGFTSLNYYSGTGEIGTEHADDYMLYADTVYQGTKYRGIIINSKRPKYTYEEPGSYGNTQSDYEIGEVYWFEYDPIEWIILDAESGFVISKAALDAQAFNNSSSSADESGNNSAYSSSSLSDYVSNTLFETALNNDTSGLLKIRDNYLFIPTKDDILNTDYGFSTDSQTVNQNAFADITDYDIANGLSKLTLNDTSHAEYWLDSEKDNTNENTVHILSTIRYCSVYKIRGVRIAAYLDLEKAANTYSLSYISDSEVINRVNLHEGDSISEYIPFREHYTFTGWDCEIPEKMPAYDITVTAGWKINSNALTLNANNGIFSDNTSIKSYNVNYGETLSDYIEIPTREGYSFSGWDNEIPDTMSDEDLILNAVWSENDDTTYKICIYKEKADYQNNNNIEYDIETINKTGKTGSIAEYSPEITDFFEFNEFESNIKETIKSDGSTVLNAYYLRKTGTVTFNLGDEYGSEDKTFRYGQKIEFPEIPERDGFIGVWDKTDEIFDGTVNEYNVLWSSDKYSITFDTDGGSEISTITAKYNAPVTRPEDPVKEGYKFIGWDKEFPDSMPIGGLELKAIWEKQTYKITYVTENNTTTVNVLYNDFIPEQEAPVKEGKTFIKWSPDLPEKMPANNLTVYAEYDTNKYTITWNYDNKSETEILYYGDKIQTFDKAEKTGYKFIKWDKVIPEIMPAENLEFNAEFEICSYKLSYISDGLTVKEYTLHYGDNVKPAGSMNKEGYTFEKWDNLPETMPDHDVESYAVFSKNYYTLTYYYGENSKTYSVGYHDALPYPDNTEIQGFNFKGWNDSIPKSMPANNLIFTAIYEPAPVVIISGCRNRTEKYKTTITFYAEYTGCSENNILWYDGNGNVIGTGEKVTVKQAKSSYSIQAKVIQEDTVSAVSAVENVTIRNGFFDKIISFFGRLFVPAKYIIDQK